MFRKTLPRQRPGRAIEARTINRTAAEVERLGSLRVEPPLDLQQTPGGPLLRLVGRLIAASIAKSGAGGVPALASNTPGSATVTLYGFDGTTLTAGDTATAFNISTTAVGANKWLILLRLMRWWFVIVESCP